MTRQEQLLRAAAKRFDDLSFFDGSFLVEHDVASNEVFPLCEVMALAIRAHCRLINKAQQKGLEGQLATNRLAEIIIEDLAEAR